MIHLAQSAREPILRTAAAGSPAERRGESRGSEHPAIIADQRAELLPGERPRTGRIRSDARIHRGAALQFRMNEGKTPIPDRAQVIGTGRRARPTAARFVLLIESIAQIKNPETQAKVSGVVSLIVTTIEEIEAELPA